MSLYPSPSFLSKNQLAKEGPDSVAPVVIPALAPSLDRSLKGDRSLCPVRALRYYLDRTADLRQNKELVFVSFKKGFDKDISPATISSWIKQTVVLCYELSDQEALTLHQVKAPDVRAFAASKAFQSGISLDQILSACHWKSHNTFTQFYLKDVSWADSELFHLGPVVAAQQVHHQPRSEGMLYMWKYVHIVKKKTVTCFPWEVYFFWDWTQPLSLYLSLLKPTLEGKKKRGGGANVGRLPVNRWVGGRPWPVRVLWAYVKWACTILFCYEFTEVPSCLPAYQAVVIQQLSIG